MGKTLATTISGNLLVRASLLTVLIVGFLGVASGVLPVGCLVTGSCKAPPTPADTAVAKLQPQMAQQNVTVAKPVVQRAAPSLTHNDVLAATFAQLKVDLAPPTATGSSSGSETQVAMATPDKAVPAAKTTVNPDSGLTTRKVKALTVTQLPHVPDQVVFSAAQLLALNGPQLSALSDTQLGRIDATAIGTATVKNLTFSGGAVGTTPVNIAVNSTSGTPAVQSTVTASAPVRA